MLKLDELREQVAKAFEAAETKESIEQLATINNTIEQVEKEQNELESKHKELLASYKDVITHQSFKDNKVDDPTTGKPEVLSLEDALTQFMENKNN